MGPRGNTTPSEVIEKSTSFSITHFDRRPRVAVLLYYLSVCAKRADLSALSAPKKTVKDSSVI